MQRVHRLFGKITRSLLPAHKSRSGSFRSGMMLMGVAALALTLSACSGTKPRQKLAYEERPVEALYNTGYQRLQSKRWNDAIDYFQEVERQHPYSEWARRAILMQVYAYYQNSSYNEAIAAADRFIALFPGNPSASYAFYMKAVCNFERIVDVGRDQGYAEAALAGLRDVERRYPNTAFATDARVKIDMVNDQLAGKEMAVGRFYQRNSQPIGALNRYKAVIENPAFQRTSHTPEALYRLVELNMQLGLRDEAVRNAAVLGHNFPGSQWYTDAFALLTDGAQGAESIQAPEAKKSWISRLNPFDRD